MNINFKSTRHIASALLLSLGSVGCAAGPDISPPELLQRIESARTRGDHEALSTHYNQQAAAARATAAEHRKMAKIYQGRVVDPRGGGSMLAHCNAIVRSQEGIAAEFEGMAEGHYELAKRAQP